MYEIARGADSAFLANLDAVVMIGLPLAGILLGLDLIQRHGLPSRPCRTPSDPTVVYRLYAADGALLYVGITRCLDRRMRQHSLDKIWWPDVARTETRLYRTRVAAARAEHSAIMGESPAFNVARLGLEAHLRSALTR